MMDVSRPLVSILMPTYQGERFIAESLSCAVGQTYPEIEVIVGDDGSTDATPDIVSEVAARDPRVRLIRNAANLGAPDNQVALHRAARGAFVKPLLQDDLLAPDAVESLIEPLLTDAGIVLAACKRGLIDERGHALPDERWSRPLTRADSVLDGASIGDAMLGTLTNLVGEVTCVMYRRESIVDPTSMWRLEGREFRTNGDVALWLRLLSRGSLFYTPRELSWFRRHDAQSSAHPSVLQRAMAEWAWLVLAGRGLGLLQDPAAERAALAAALAAAASALAPCSGDPEHAPALRAAIQAALDRLGAPALAPPPSRFALAISAPASDADEIRAGVAGLRGAILEGAAERCVLALSPRDLDRAVHVAEAALSEGPDVELEVIATDAPGELSQEPWLAIVTGDAGWATRAAARRPAGVAPLAPSRARE